MRRNKTAFDAYKRFGLVIALALLAVYAYANLLGPQGVRALQANWEEQKRIQMQNADLLRDLEEKKERVRILENSREQRELEIRKKLHKLLPGERLYQVPDLPDTDPAPSGAGSAPGQ